MANDLEKRTQQRLDVVFGKKQLKESTKIKQEYLAYNKEMKKKGLKPLTYGTWQGMKKTGAGTSKQTQRQLQTLSQDDAAAIEKMLKGGK